MSKEHVVANWVGNVLPRYSMRHIMTSSHETPEGWSPTVAKRENGHMGTRQIRRVCRVCNNGWMKAIQDKAKPVLSPLMRGEWMPTVVEHTFVMSQWAGMTSMNLDASYWEAASVPFSDRNSFRETGMLPTTWRVWIGRCSGPFEMSMFHTPMTLATPPEEGEALTTNNAHSNYFQLGQLVIHTVRLPASVGFKLNPVTYGAALGLVPLFPVWGGDVLDWRYAPILRADHLHVTRMLLKNLIDTGRKDLTPRGSTPE